MTVLERYRRLLLTIIVLTYLLPIPAMLLIWWLVDTRTALGFDAAITVSILASLGVGTLLAIGLFNRLINPLQNLTQHLEALSRGDGSYRSRKGRSKYFNFLYGSLNDLGGQIQSYTEHSKAELGVIKAEANRLRAVLNSINDGVVALDKDARIVLFNKAASKISGFSLEEAAGKPVSQVLPLLKGNSLAINEWLQSTIGTDIRDHSWENLRLKTKDDKTRSVDAEILYQGADPNGIRTLITFHDRTEAQELEDMKVDFVALAAHELRTPISIIRGYLEILEDELGDKLTVEQTNFMSKLNVSAAQLAGFINNILHVSRIEHGNLNLKLETADWGELVNQTVAELTNKAALQDKKLELTLGSNLPKVAVDKMSITEVLNNLIDNAIKYSERNTTVYIEVKASGDRVETIIKDQGVGIPENAIDKLFTKFYRSHRTRSSHRGTGLGLYMSKAIVEAHGGTVWVHSKIGEGSTFGFLLPIYNKQTSPHVALEPNNKITRGVHGWIKNHSLYRG